MTRYDIALRKKPSVVSKVPQIEKGLFKIYAGEHRTGKTTCLARSIIPFLHKGVIWVNFEDRMAKHSKPLLQHLISLQCSSPQLIEAVHFVGCTQNEIQHLDRYRINCLVLDDIPLGGIAGRLPIDFGDILTGYKNIIMSCHIDIITNLLRITGCSLDELIIARRKWQIECLIPNLGDSRNIFNNEYLGNWVQAPSTDLM